jgi:hypothetical protein
VFKVRTAIFLTAGWAIISEVSEGVLATDIGTMLTTPWGNPAWNQSQPGQGSHSGKFTDIVQRVYNEGGGVWADFRGTDHNCVATNKWKGHRHDH